MITIDDALGIEVTKRTDLYIADATKLPGTPPIGRGKNVWQAKYDLLAKLMWDRVYDRSDYAHIAYRLLREAWDKI